MKKIILRYKKSVIVLLQIGLILLLCGSFVGIMLLFYPFSKPVSVNMAVAGSTYFVVFVTIGWIYSGFQAGTKRATEIIYSLCLATLLACGAAYFQMCLLFKQILPVTPVFLCLVAHFGTITLMSVWIHSIHEKLSPPAKTLLIYDPKNTLTSLFSKLRRYRGNYHITNAVQSSLPFEMLVKYIDRSGAVIFLAESADNQELRNQVIEYCYSHNKKTYIVPMTVDILLNNAGNMQFGDMAVYECGHKGILPEQAAVKRAIDLLVSGMGILLTSPVMLFVAAAIRLYDHGPVFFRQKRLTLNGREFEVYKFRSMIVQAEKDGVARLASKNDNRITPVGKIIRKLRIDELPQLINIFSGDMSLVGPRPERPELAYEYEKQMPQFAHRLKVKAGLTGYAQVLGKYNTTAKDKLLLDLIYIEHYSLWLDFKLLFMTFKILFLSESTEGVDG